MRTLTTFLALLAMLTGLRAQYAPPGFPELIQTIDHPVIASGNFMVTKQILDKHSQVWHAYGHQTYQGLPIEGAVFSAHAQHGAVVAFHQQFVEPAYLVPTPQAHSLGQGQALDYLVHKLSAHFSNPGQPAEWRWTTLNDQHFELSWPGLSPERIRAKKTYFLAQTGLVPSWSISILLPDQSHWYYAVIDARNGNLLDINDWMLSCREGHWHAATHNAGTVHPGKSSSRPRKANDGSYTAFGLGIESPSHGERQLLESPANPTASPYGWHDTDGVSGAELAITFGNNVWAREDRDDNNIDGYSPDGGTNLEFDFPFAQDAGPDSNLSAAITNLFVWNNFMHDVWYQYGFDEESGNFQLNHYGRANEGAGDFVFADAQDGSGTNNANFATPEDGMNPRMQMFLWGVAGALTLDVHAPSANEGKYTASGAAFGPRLGSTPIKAELVVVRDGSASPTLACDSPLLNPQDIKGKIALIERGTCTFVSKVRHAQMAGAIAVVIYSDNRPVIEMGGDGTQGDITIPSIMIQRSLGLTLAGELANRSFEVSLYNTSGSSGFDSDFDNGVISHEYGHGISTRLTGGAMNSNCLRNQEQMGEGWSDFFALVMTQQPDDKGGDLRGIGTFLQNQPITGGGIRPYPYSTDASKSPYAYENIATLSIPHGVGAVWCAMLWDMYWAFIETYGYDPDLYDGTGGNNMALQLVIDGMKLQPCNPGFTDARDAILLADKLNNGGKNEKLIWKAFTDRGLGWDADGGDPNNRTDGKNGFEMPPKYRGYVGITKLAVTVANEDETITYKIEIENGSEETYRQVVVTDTLPSALELVKGSADCDWAINGNIMVLNIPELAPGATVTCSYNAKPKPGPYTTVYVEDGAEAPGGRWSTVSDIGTEGWILQSGFVSQGDSCWFVPNPFAQSDQSLMFDIGLIEPGASLHFWHAYNTNTDRDGGVIEFTEDGINWFDAEPYFTRHGYNAEISNNPNTPLNGRALFSGNSNGFVESHIDLKAFVGKDILVRFRFASDRFFSGLGWYVDDVKVLHYAAVTNKAYATQSDKTMGSEVTTVIYDVLDNGIASQDRPYHQVLVYPNPGSAFTSLQVSGALGQGSCTLVDINGRELYSVRIGEGLNALDLREIMKGTYLLKMVFDNGYREIQPLMVY
ncbi:MAG: M36 family metallopeptidase [Bacteroidetes bacterium]|jgi:uncharacterized repeat protein (TIGR01451 family)|nr:M36 family metallopeptidase [Bacteroidota bacterium]